MNKPLTEFYHQLYGYIGKPTPIEIEIGLNISKLQSRVQRAQSGFISAPRRSLTDKVGKLITDVGHLMKELNNNNDNYQRN